MITQKFNEQGQHKLVNTETEQETQWAAYSQFTYLDGYVGVTGYYLDKEAVLIAGEFCKIVGVGK